MAYRPDLRISEDEEMNVYHFACAGLIAGKVRAGSEYEALKIAKKKVRQHMSDSDIGGDMPKITLALTEPGDSGSGSQQASP